jgi:hypothetical protein
VPDVAPTRWFLAVLILNVAAAPAFAHEGDSLSPAPPPGSPSTVLPKTTTSPAEARPTVWPFVLIGAGALTLGTGIWLVHRDHSDDAAPACTTVSGGRTSCPYGTSTQWQGWGFVALGAQLAIAGVAWRIYETRHHSSTTLSLAAGPGALRLVGTF